MLKNKITFCATSENMVDVRPHPQPAGRFIPDSYKKLEKFKDNNIHDITVKSCIPVLDSLTCGYIIPFDQDYVVDIIGDDFSVTPANKEKFSVDYHRSVQIPDTWKEVGGNMKHAGKFINKWLIKTPPGYSCLFVKPLNHFETRFEIISGVVDTDTYINTINFPFLLHQRDKQFLIKKGDPLVQVIPFKRQKWKKWSGFYKEKLHESTLMKLESYFFDKYKRLFWHKKEYK